MSLKEFDFPYSIFNSGNVSTFRYQWELIESEINKPIDDRVFDYEQLGLKDGERVLDRVDNIGYIYSNGKLTEPRKFKVEVAAPNGRGQPEPKAGLGLLVSVNLTLILCGVLAYWLIARSRRT